MDETSRLESIAGKMKSEKARKSFLAFMASLAVTSEDDDCIEDVATTLESDLEELQRRKLLQLEEELRVHYNPGNESVAVLIDSSDINFRGAFGLTKLHEAVMESDVTAVADLVQRGADRTIRDNSGHTPMDKAARLGNSEIIALLA